MCIQALQNQEVWLLLLVTHSTDRCFVWRGKCKTKTIVQSQLCSSEDENGIRFLDNCALFELSLQQTRLHFKPNVNNRRITFEFVHFIQIMAYGSGARILTSTPPSTSMYVQRAGIGPLASYWDWRRRHV